MQLWTWVRKTVRDGVFVARTNEEEKVSDSARTYAIAGATGAVGREMIRILGETDLPVGEIRLLASHRSVGKKLTFRDRTVEVTELTPDSFDGVDIALFSCGSGRSKEFAPAALRSGTVVIDNSSAFRMDPEIPLVVPEVNAEACDKHPGIIANPNCSTIQMVLPLKVLADHPGISRIVVSTYQSASGAGQAGVDELVEQTRRALAGEPLDSEVFAHPLAFEALPHIGSFKDSGYTTEELKMTYETRKIMGLPDLESSATCVRVPVMRGHSEAVTVELNAPVDLEDIRRRMDAFPNLSVVDDVQRNKYPLARVADGCNDTFVGRFRKDIDRDSTLHFWVVSDNLLKGAAFNAVQIAEYVVSKELYGAPGSC